MVLLSRALIPTTFSKSQKKGLSEKSVGRANIMRRKNSKNSRPLPSVIRINMQFICLHGKSAGQNLGVRRLRAEVTSECLSSLTKDAAPDGVGDRQIVTRTSADNQIEWTQLPDLENKYSEKI